MQFDTATYVVFLTLVVGLYWTLRGHSTARVALLLAASFLFYGWWDARFLVLIVASTVLDYWVGARLHRSESTSVRRRYLFLSILGNLGVLSFFKYTNFLAQSVLQIGSWWSGEAAQFDPYSILLPVGISFYTFQSMSYTIDIYRRRLQPVNSFLQFALFVAFFPQLVAGPIVRARNFLPQLKGVPRFAPRRMSRGLSLILVGLVKKVAFADALGTFVVDRVFLAPEKFQALDALFAAYAYSFQIYFDFSAYSDIAIGSALLLALRLPVNFRHPFLASNPSDLWRRWHISLSTWLRDYLYISLGGNRRGAWRTRCNLMLTMLLGGLWHGAAWNFVFWGFLHGFYLLAHRLLTVWEPAAAALRSVPKAVKILFMFHLTCLAFVFFRAASFGDAWDLLAAVAGDGGDKMLRARWWWLAGFVVVAFCHLTSGRWFRPLQLRYLRLPALVQALVLALMTGLLGAVAYGERPFIYFQF